jgi:hypothetical protein
MIIDIRCLQKIFLMNFETLQCLSKYFFNKKKTLKIYMQVKNFEFFY